MKTKILTLIITLTTILAFAQTSEHLSFKSVPINGTLDEYVSKMKQNGFTLMSTEDGVAILKGDFAGYKGCIVGVSTLKQKDLVYKIAVIFPEGDTWSTLSGNYLNLKQMLTEKYGTASDVVEKFDDQSDSSSQDDDSKMYSVKFDNCKYSSVWQTDKGEIRLSIDHNGIVSCYVTLVYSDKTNNDIMRAKAKGDL